MYLLTRNSANRTKVNVMATDSILTKNDIQIDNDRVLVLNKETNNWECIATFRFTSATLLSAKESAEMFARNCLNGLVIN